MNTGGNSEYGIRIVFIGVAQEKAPNVPRQEGGRPWTSAESPTKRSTMDSFPAPSRRSCSRSAIPCGRKTFEEVFRKWLNRIPPPLRPQDRETGYDWDLSIWQMEVSLTQIFDRPLRGRAFLKGIIRHNLDLGRPDGVQLIYDRVVTKETPGKFRTRVIQNGVHPSLHIQYKNFDLKQYFKKFRNTLWVEGGPAVHSPGVFPPALAMFTGWRSGAALPLRTSLNRGDGQLDELIGGAFSSSLALRRFCYIR